MSELKVIARMRSEFSSKFGIPRQSGLVPALRSRVVFEEAYRNPEALRGLEDFSHLWLIWGFSEAERADWSPTVRPPRLGGNTRMGVFATRSPYRPNAIGLSSVEIERIERQTPLGPVIHLRGADLMDGTPIYDIKPYLPYVDCHPDASGGFAGDAPAARLRVEIGDRWLGAVPADKREVLRALLAQDPRPAYQNDPERVYGMAFAGLEVRFSVEGETLRVREITESADDKRQDDKKRKRGPTP